MSQALRIGFFEKPGRTTGGIAWKAQIDASLRHSAHDGQKPEFPRLSPALPTGRGILNATSPACGRENTKKFRIPCRVGGRKSDLISWKEDCGFVMTLEIPNPQQNPSPTKKRKT
jgi:hypothetical protein